MEIREALEKIGYCNLKETNGWFRARPLYRSSDNDTVLSINKTTGYWFDYKLNKGGKLSELVQLSLGLKSIEEANIYLKEQLKFVAPQVDPDETKIKQLKTWPPEILEKLIREYSYWENRGISKVIIAEFGGGIAENGKLKGRFIFPIYNPDGKIVGFSGRLLEKNDNLPKWKHLGMKSEWIYPAYFNNKREKYVILVESIGDMLALWQCGEKNVLVTFGLNVSGKIIKYLLSHQINKIIIAFNNDSEKNSAGNEAAESAKYKLMTFFDIDSILIKLPNKKDFGEMTQEEIKEYLKHV